MKQASPWLLLLLAACAPGPAKGPDTTAGDTSSADTDDDVPGVSDDTVVDSALVADTDTDTDLREPPSPDWQSLELHGEFPRAFLLPPDSFVALNADGQERGPPDLVGHPTVLWFFPASGTPS